MPDIKTYLRNAYIETRWNGLRAGLKSAGAEALLYWYNKVEDRGRLIWEDDWDVCCVIDACRYDAFRQVRPEFDWLPSGSAWSVGSASPEWYGRTFAPESHPPGGLSAVGLVTANPFSAKPADRAAGAPPGSLPVDRHGLGYLDEVWRDHWGCDVEGGYLDVVHPSLMVDRAYAAWTEHDLDRLVVHFMQPHIPFRAHPEWFGARANLQHFGEVEKEGNAGNDPWKRVRRGELPRAEFWSAYCDNLRWVLDEIGRLRRAVDARVLITSDHGNGLGEWGVWSHPPNRAVPVLRRVPWVSVEAKAVAPLESGEYTTYSTDTRPIDLDDQLAALGYVEASGGPA